MIISIDFRVCVCMCFFYCLFGRWQQKQQDRKDIYFRFVFMLPIGHWQQYVAKDRRILSPQVR